MKTTFARVGAALLIAIALSACQALEDFDNRWKAEMAARPDGGLFYGADLINAGLQAQQAQSSRRR